MCGFLIGTACLIGLIKVLRHGRGCHGGGCGGCGGGRGWGRWGHHGHHHGPGGGGWGGWGGGGPERWFLRGLFERLDTTPGQEKVILASVEQVRERVRTLREEVDRTRGDVARAMREPALDEAALAAVWARHDAAVTELRTVFGEALGKVHEALDERQRRELADMIESGGFFRRHHHGPYRG